MGEIFAVSSQEVGALGERVAALLARREMRKLRLDQLGAMVGEAKARIARQPKAKEFLERLQEISHKKSVGLYEELLSAVVQDVLPGEKNVALRLETDRGAPSLDIEMVTAGGKRESILEGSGGALTNILSAGLRVIALARSGAYPFLVLDEPDCWLKPSRVPQFANVLGQIAEDLQIQVLLISHHDADFFARFSSQVALVKRGGALEAHWASPPDPHAWDDATQGIKELRLFDFMSHEKTVIPLAPGVTCLTGENDIGKSAIVAGLRALFYGKAKDHAIAHGKTQFKVEAVFHDDAVLSLERYLTKSPKQRWRYWVKGVSEPVQDSSPSSGAPDWVEHVANIAHTEDLDIAFANQKSPVFLLDQPPARRASILAVGRESAHLQRLIAKNKERNLIDGKLKKDGEAEGAAIGRELALLNLADGFDERVGFLRRDLPKHQAQAAQVEAARVALRRLAALGEALAHAQALGDSATLGVAPMEPTDSLRSDLARLGRLAGAAKAEAPRPAMASPQALGTDALSFGISRLSRSRAVAGFNVSSRHVEAPEMQALGPLASAVARLRWATVAGRAEPPRAAMEAPALVSAAHGRSAIERLGRLQSIEAALGMDLNRLSAPSAPAISGVDRLDATCSLVRALGERIAKLERNSVIGARKAAELDARMDALANEAGGVCQTCKAPLDVAHLKNMMHGAAHD